MEQVRLLCGKRRGCGVLWCLVGQPHHWSSIGLHWTTPFCRLVPPRDPDEVAVVPEKLLEVVELVRQARTHEIPVGDLEARRALPEEAKIEQHRARVPRRGRQLRVALQEPELGVKLERPAARDRANLGRRQCGGAVFELLSTRQYAILVGGHCCHGRCCAASPICGARSRARGPRRAAPARGTWTAPRRIRPPRRAPACAAPPGQGGRGGCRGGGRALGVWVHSGGLWRRGEGTCKGARA